MSLAQQSLSASINGAANSISASFSKDCTVVENIEIPLTASMTDDPTTIAIPYATISALAIQAYFPPAVAGDATSNVTVKTNSSSSPAQTLTCVPNKATVWNDDMAITNPITANITAFYVTNPNTVAGTLRITLGRNPT